MDVGTVIQISQHAMWMVALLAGPLLLVGLVVGLVVSILQATTQINEQTLTFLPKMAAVLVAAVVFGPWMLNQLVSFTRGLIVQMPGLVR